ncbi:hypothetical protein Hanom_Chr04g00328071 [Helianthus anomalus]
MKHCIYLIAFFHFQLQQNVLNSAGELESFVQLCVCVCVRERERERGNLIRSLLPTKTTPIKQKSNRVKLDRLSVTVSIHKLLQLCASFDPKKHFITILRTEEAV